MKVKPIRHDKTVELEEIFYGNCFKTVAPDSDFYMRITPPVDSDKSLIEIGQTLVVRLETGSSHYFPKKLKVFPINLITIENKY